MLVLVLGEKTERERERVKFGGDDVYYYRVGTVLSKLSGDTVVMQSLWVKGLKTEILEENVK